MAKNNNKGAKTPKKPAEAPKVETPEVEAQTVETTETPKIVDFGAMGEAANKIAQYNAVGLSPDCRATLLHDLHETFLKDPNAAERYHMDQGTVNRINELTAHGMVATLCVEVVYAKNPFALALKPQEIDVIAEIGSKMGLVIDRKLLPAPNAEGVVNVPSTAVKVDKQTEKEIKEEIAKAEKEVELDPTKIDSPEALKAALIHILCERAGNPWEKMDAAVTFMYKYDSHVNASDPTTQAKLNKRSAEEVVKRISEIVGRCSFVVRNFVSAMVEQSNNFGSPVKAFFNLINCFNASNPDVTPNEYKVASYLKGFCAWALDTMIADTNNHIAENKKNIEVLSKDKKANDKAIKKAEKDNEGLEARVNKLKEAYDIFNLPSSDVADNLLEDLKSKDVRVFNRANDLYKAVTKAYFANALESLTTMEDKNKGESDEYKSLKASLDHNVQQMVGIALNYFRPANAQLENYSTSNLVSLEPVEKTAEDSKQEGESKK